MLHFQAVYDLLPPGAAKKALEKALARADQAIVEGRDAIQNLRSSTTVTNDLAEAITSLAEELSAASDGGRAPPTFRVSIEGKPRDLPPVLRDAIYRYQRKALPKPFPRHPPTK